MIQVKSDKCGANETNVKPLCRYNGTFTQFFQGLTKLVIAEVHEYAKGM